MRKSKILIYIFIILIINALSMSTISLAKIENNIEDEVNINSHIGLIYDRSSGRVIYEKNGYEKYKMASTTKIMTAIVIIENVNLSDTVVIDKQAASTGGSRLGLKTNDKVTVSDLLYGLLLSSGNDAAVALANYASGSVEKFALLMNNKAKELNLKNTNYVVPHGLDNDNHYTTAYELAVLTDYALNNEIFRNIVNTKAYTVNINGNNKRIINTNELLGNLNGVYGVKTGFTNGAGRCLVTACEREGLDVITVVLGAETKKMRTNDSINLIEYAFKSFEIVDVQNIVNEKFENWKKDTMNNIVVYKGISNVLDIQLGKQKYIKIALSEEEKNDVKTCIDNILWIEAPIQKGAKIGEINVSIGENVLEIIDINIENEIERKGIYNYFQEFLRMIY